MSDRHHKHPSTEYSGGLPPVVAFILWVVALAAAMLLATNRVWGLHLLTFVDPVVRWSFGAGAIVAIIAILRPPGVFRSLAGFGRKIGRALHGWRGGLVFATLIGVCGWLLRARTTFLGDGTLRANDAIIGAPWYPSEFLPTYLFSLVARYLAGPWRSEGTQAISIVTVGLAVVFAVFVYILTPKATRDRSRVAIFYLVTFGSIRLLAGYIESYPAGFAAVALWALAAVAYRRGRISWIWPVVLWCVALASHITSILLIPATAWLFWAGPRPLPANTSVSAKSTRRTKSPKKVSPRKNRSEPTVVGMQLVPLTIFLMVAIGFGGAVLYSFRELQVTELGVTESHFLLPLLAQPPHEYGILSPDHWIDVVNHFWLLMPAGIVAVLAGLSPKSIRAAVQAIKEKFSGPALKSDVTFWLLAAGLPLLLGIVVDPKLGWARDWDLFCLLSTPALVGTALWLARLRGPRGRAAAAVAVLSSALWLVYSVDADAERRRYEALLDLDPTRSDYGHEIMGQYYRDRDDHAKALEHYQKALLVSDNMRYRLNIAAAYLAMHQDAECERWYRSVVDRDSTSATGAHGLALVLEKQGKREEAFPHAERAVEIEPNNPLFRYEYAKLMMELGDTEGALPHFERAARTPPLEALFIHGLGVCYLALNRLAEARIAFEQALKRQPNNAPLVLDAARVALLQTRIPETINLVDRYKHLVPEQRRDPDLHLITDSLGRLTGR